MAHPVRQCSVAAMAVRVSPGRAGAGAAGALLCWVDMARPPRSTPLDTPKGYGVPTFRGPPAFPCEGLVGRHGTFSPTAPARGAMDCRGDPASQDAPVRRRGGRAADR